MTLSLFRLDMFPTQKYIIIYLSKLFLNDEHILLVNFYFFYTMFKAKPNGSWVAASNFLPLLSVFSGTKSLPSYLQTIEL